MNDGEVAEAPIQSRWFFWLVPAMIVYARTPEGQIAAYSPESALPRKLKSLLKVVDGKTDLAVLVDHMQAFGDVRGVLQSLHAAGLLKLLSETDSKSPRQVGNAAGGDTAEGPDTIASSSHSTLMLQPNKADPKQKQALDHAVDLMADFVLTHIPVKPLDILKELESLESLEQLGAMLGGYEQEIAHVGPATQGHLLQIRQILREYL